MISGKRCRQLKFILKHYFMTINKLIQHGFVLIACRPQFTFGYPHAEMAPAPAAHKKAEGKSNAPPAAKKTVCVLLDFVIFRVEGTGLHKQSTCFGLQKWQGSYWIPAHFTYSSSWRRKAYNNR